MIDSANISPNVARRILLDAKQNGVTVEDYLEKIAEQSIEKGNKNFRAIRRIESKVDLTEERDAQMLGLELEKGDVELVRTATGKFIAHGHEVTLNVGNLEWEATVYFAADEFFPINVFGRIGFLDRLKIGLVDYEQLLYLTSYNE